MGSRKISKTTIDAAVSSLKQLPVKQKDSFDLREAIYEMRKDLEAILKKGYSYQELAEFLSTHEIQIQAATLKQYLNSFKRKAKKADAGPKGKASAARGALVERSSKGKSGKERSVKTVAVVEDDAPQAEVTVGDGFVDMPDEL